MTDEFENQRDKLAAELGSGEWSLLSAHAQSGSLIIVSPGVDLLDVAAAVANDDSTQVTAWIEGGILTRDAADESNEGRFFNFIVVNPFVLAQRLDV